MQQNVEPVHELTGGVYVQVLGSLGACEAMVGAVKSFPEDPKVVTGALDALALLVTESTDNEERLRAVSPRAEPKS
jgi:hypothetical protein